MSPIFLFLLTLIPVLKKYFEQSPYSKTIEMDSQTELRCIPPDGIPMPAISWLRDGRVIERESNSNYIITADGHLLIAQTRLSDMGNYSCVAENIASRRVSEPALLTVYGMSSQLLISLLYFSLTKDKIKLVSGIKCVVHMSPAHAPRTPLTHYTKI